MKKALALLLSLVTILSGIYWVDMTGSEVKAANAQSDLFETKVQVAEKVDVIRFVSSVESLDYKEVGFEVTPAGGTTKTYTTKVVYERIESTTEGVEYTFSPKVVDVDSEYFFTGKLEATAGVNYTVRAFGTLKDGSKVYGATRCVSLEDGRTTSTLNLSFYAETAPTVGSKLDVTYGSANTKTTADVISVNDGYATVRVSVNPTTLPSATKFDFGTYGSTIYRNLYTKYTGEGTDDQTWYDVYLAANPDQTAFTIATNADLYGFMNMMVDKNLFKNKTVYLISDIAMNDNVTDTVVEAWANGTEAPYKWTSAGTDSTATQFTGTFDGQMHTISGVYMKQNKQRAGFFGCTAKESLVKNFYLTDSYFESAFTTNVQHLGSVAGECWGDIENVYSDAIVAGSHNRVGGIVGVLNTVTAAEELGMQAEVNNCWFDGEVRMTTDNGRYFGGIVGYVMQREVQIKDCLFTGKLTYTYKTGGVHAGGILGGNNNKPVVHMEDVVSAGQILGEYWICTGTIYGYRTNTTTKFEVVNGYSVNESLVIPEGTEGCTTGQLNGGGASGSTGTGPGTALAEANLQGINAYKNTLLDFENTWVARTGKVPTLKVFDKMYEASEVITDFGTTKQDGWYNANNNRYGIHTVAGLNGLVAVSKTQTFSGKTIYLSKDIDINPGWVAPKDATTAVTGNPVALDGFLFDQNNGGKALEGTFDGRKHTISGLYINTTKSPAALFGRVNGSGALKNLAINNAYVKQDATGGAWASGVLGFCFGGIVDGIYCNATVITNATVAQAGGVIGRAEGTIKNCWFDGNLIHIGETDGKVELGGIAGRSWGRTSATAALRVTSFTNCLNTGNISYNPTTAGGTGAGIGGILGTDTGYSELTITNCVNLGKIDTNKSNGVGGCIGMLSGSNGGQWVNATVSNCYTTSDCIVNKGSAKPLAYKNVSSVVTETGNASIARATLESAAIYENASILLDYTSWIARSNGSPIPTVFVDWIVPASQTVAKPAATE